MPPLPSPCCLLCQPAASPIGRHMRGVILWGVEAGRIAWGRLYMEPVVQDEIGIAGMINAMTSGS